MTRPPSRPLAVLVLAAVGLLALFLLLASGVAAWRAGGRMVRRIQALVAREAAAHLRAELQAARERVDRIDLADMPPDPEAALAWLASRDAYAIDGLVGLAVVDVAGRPEVVLGEAPAHLHRRRGDTGCLLCLRKAGRLVVVGPVRAGGRHVEALLDLQALADRLDFAPEVGLTVLLDAAGAVVARADPGGGEPLDPVRLEREGMLVSEAPVGGPAPDLSVAVVSEVAVVGRSLARALVLQGLAALGLLVVTVGGGVVADALARRAWAREREMIAERLAMQEAAAHAERLATIGTLTAGFAHDLRGPLTALRLGLDELRAEDADPEVLRDMEQSVARIASLVDDTTRFARGEAGGGCARPAEVARTVARLAAPRLGPGVRLEVEADGAPPVAMDPGHLSQVLLNLVLNAVDALGGEGRVRVEAGAEAGGAWIRVEDDGPGLPDEVADHLFEPFRTTKPPGRGTGLGLFMCRTLVEAAGGRIELARRRPAAFVLHLPGERARG